MPAYYRYLFGGGYRFVYIGVLDILLLYLEYIYITADVHIIPHCSERGDA